MHIVQLFFVCLKVVNFFAMSGFTYICHIPSLSIVSVNGYKLVFKYSIDYC